MLAPLLKKNNRQARLLILTVSFVVFAAVVLLSRVHVEVDLGFDVHIFAAINAVVNTLVSIVLIAAFVAVRRKNYLQHRNLMIGAMLLSILFLISYIAHHLFAGETTFGGTGTALRTFYYIILISHIILAAVILPFILFTAYRGLTGEYATHRKLARYTWPLWLYVSISGVIVYLMISPYYP